jgi:small redox-active disulfide protein 2
LAARGGLTEVHMKIQILGSGCAKCRLLEENVKTAVKNTGVSAEVGKVTDPEQIIGFGVMMTPALVVDGEVRSSGRVLSADQVAQIIAPGENR